MRLREAFDTALTLPMVPLRLARMVGTTALGAPAFLTEERLRGMPYDRRDAYVKWWCGNVLDALGVDVIDDFPSTPLGPIPAGGRMIVSNHRSMIDILVLLSRFGGHMLSRADLAKWPVIGWLAHFSETLYVDRSSPTSGAASIRRVTRCLSDRHAVTVFAEGTTYPDDELRPFQAGAFISVAASGGEVVPVGIAYESPHAIFFQEPFAAHARKVLLAHRTRVALSVGNAIAAEKRSSKSLNNATHERVQALVRRARSLV